MTSSQLVNRTNRGNGGSGAARPRVIDLSELCDVLRLCIKEGAATATFLRIDLTTPTHIYGMGLLLAMLDHGRAVLALANAEAYSGIPLVTRAALEGYVDLVNLCDRATYWESLDAADTAEWRKVLDAAVGDRNPVLAQLRQDPSFEDGRKLYARRAQELGAANIKKLKVYERFALAGMAQEHESIYAMLCAEAHSNVSILQSRYFVATEDGIAVRDRSNDSANAGHHYELPCTLHMSELILMSTEKMLRHCGHGIAGIAKATALFQELHDSLEQRRTTL